MAAEQLTPIEGIRRELQRTVAEYITGTRETGGGRPASDDSWFGPDSMTWLVHSDWSNLIGGVASLLTQTLFPPAMAGVADHSNYAEDPFGRLHRTADFIGTTTFRSAEEAEQMVKAIRKVHDRVTGVTPAGVPYEANDPHNLAWEHCTEVDGFMRGYRRYGAAPINDAEADQYVAEMARVGVALGVVDAPRSVAELDDRLRSYLPDLGYGKQAREAVRFLLFPPHKIGAQAPYAIILTAAINLLPAWARRKLWIPPRIPIVSDALVAPAANALVGTLGWIMTPPPEIIAMREKRAS